MIPSVKACLAGPQAIHSARAARSKRKALGQQIFSQESVTLADGYRTMDILHVACDVEISASGFLTFDKRQCERAHFAGLNVIALE